MDFRLTGSAGCKADSCSALELSPPARTILPLKAHDVPNPTADGNAYYPLLTIYHSTVTHNPSLTHLPPNRWKC